MSNIPKIDNRIINGTLIVVVILVLFAVFIFGKKVFQSLGIVDTAEEIAVKESTDKAIEKAIKDATASGIKPTKPQSFWTLQANALYEALKYSAISDDKTKAYYILSGVLNDADAALLIKGFGRRQDYVFGVPTSDTKDLKTFVNSNLSQDDINSLNDLYRRSKMSFRL